MDREGLTVLKSILPCWWWENSRWVIDWQELALDWHRIDIRLAPDWNRIGMDWSLIDTGAGTGLASDWHWIGNWLTWDSNKWTLDLHPIGAGLALDWHQIGTGLASDGDAMASAWHKIGIRLALDWHYIGTGLGWIDVELTMDWQNWHWIDVRLELDWHRIGPRHLTGGGLETDWLDLHRIGTDWGWIGNWLTLQ